MKVDQRIAGKFAIASGIVTIVAAVVLVIFFLVEAPALIESGDVDRITVFGSTNDALIALALMLLLPVASFVARTAEPKRLDRVLGFVGLAGLGFGTVFMVTTALRVIDYATNSLLIGVAFALVGAWLLALNVPAGASALFSRGARSAGILAGLAFLARCSPLPPGQPRSRVPLHDASRRASYGPGAIATRRQWKGAPAVARVGVGGRLSYPLLRISPQPRGP